MQLYYRSSHKDKNLKIAIGKSNMGFDDMNEYIWRLERRAIQIYPSISAFCKEAKLERGTFKRLRQRGLYSINYLTLLRLCYGLKLMPNQIMRFEEWEDLEIASIPIDENCLERIRIDWKVSMNNWFSKGGKTQRPKTDKRYGEANF